MKLINIFFLLFLSFSGKMFGADIQKFNPVVIPSEIWFDIAKNMGKEGYNLFVSGKASLGFEDATFQEALQLRGDPFIKAIAEKQASQDLADNAFDFSWNKFTFVPFEVFDKKEGIYKPLNENITGKMEKYYKKYTEKYRTKYCLEYTKSKLINKADIEKNNILSNKIPSYLLQGQPNQIKYYQEDKIIDEMTYSVEFFENNDPQSVDEKGEIIPYATLKIHGLTLNKTADLDTYAFLNGIIEEEKRLKIVRILVVNITYNPQIIYDNWKYKNITLQKISSGNTILHDFVKNNNVEGITILNSAGCNPNVRNLIKKTPLEVAVETSDIETIKALLEFKNIDINGKLIDFIPKRTLLEDLIKFSTRVEKNQIIELLLQKGVDPNQKFDSTQESLLAHVCGEEDAALVSLLLRYGAHINVFLGGYSYKIPLHIAVEEYQKSPENSLKIIKLLLAFGANINIQNLSQETPLYLACKKGYYEVVELLVKNGADIDIKDQLGKTPLDIAKEKKHEKIIELLEVEQFKKLRKAPFYQKHKKTIYTFLAGLFAGGLGIFGILKYLQHKKDIQTMKIMKDAFKTH